MATLCLLCKKEEPQCKCEGGFKVIYHFGVPKSHAEMKAFNSKSPMEKSLALNKFMAERTDAINDKIADDMNAISENQLKVSDATIKLAGKINNKRKK